MRRTRALLACGLGASVLAFVPSSAVAADCVPVLHVTFQGTTEPPDRTVCIDDLAAWHDVVNKQYRTRKDPGDEPRSDPYVSEGLSVSLLIQHLSDENPGLGVTYVEVANPRNSPGRLRPADLSRDPAVNNFENGLLPAFYYEESSQLTWYIRPLRNDLSDTNSGESFPSAGGAPLEVVVHTSGDILVPTISVDRNDPAANQAVQFTAGQLPDGLEYRWSFGDGQTSTALAPSHAWKSAGTYRAYLEVNRPGELAFQSNVLLITVGTPVKPIKEHKPKPPDDGGGKGGPHNPETGPQDSKGHQGGAKPDPSADPEADHGVDGTDAESTAPPAPDPKPDSKPPAKQQTGGRQETHDGQLTGILLAGAVTGATESGTPETAPSARATSDPPLRLPGWVGLAAGGALLLGLGALSESRWLRRRLGRGPGMMRP